MTTPRAADLPVGSVVANNKTAYVKRKPDYWRGTDGREWWDVHIGRALNDGAQVLRVGDGSEHP